MEEARWMWKKMVKRRRSKVAIRYLSNPSLSLDLFFRAEARKAQGAEGATVETREGINN